MDAIAFGSIIGQGNKQMKIRIYQAAQQGFRTIEIEGPARKLWRPAPPLRVSDAGASTAMRASA
jgi:hypothetical protein